VHRTVVQAREEGHLAADMDAEQMVFELHGLILALQYEARFLRSSKSLTRTLKGFENILQRYGASVARPLIKTSAKRTTSTKK
jgi:hypothetical protein